MYFNYCKGQEVDTIIHSVSDSSPSTVLFRNANLLGNKDWFLWYMPLNLTVAGERLSCFSSTLRVMSQNVFVFVRGRGTVKWGGGGG